MPFTRPSGRTPDQLRPLSFEVGVSMHAEGSCLVKTGHTHVLVTASVEPGVPGWLRGSGKGWVTAEYGMLPRATDTRGAREAARGKQSGRTQEIQRLIGRALRAIIDLRALGEFQIKLDCDVLQADGGTRTASISGAYVALAQAVEHMRKLELIAHSPLRESVAAVSCGLLQDTALLDLDYAEDSNADADANFVLTQSGRLIEIQATAETEPFTRPQLDALLDLAQKGTQEIVQAQEATLRATA